MPAVGAMLDRDTGINAAANVELGVDMRMNRGAIADYQVRQHLVGDGFMECPLIAIRPEIEFQAPSVPGIAGPARIRFRWWRNRADR